MFMGFKIKYASTVLTSIINTLYVYVPCQGEKGARWGKVGVVYVMLQGVT